MNYLSEVSHEIHLALMAIHRASNVALEAGDNELWFELISSDSPLRRINLAAFDKLYGTSIADGSSKDTCPECERTNLNESKTRCFDCEPSI